MTHAPAGFAESFMQELGHFWRENLSISRNLALDSAKSDRAQKIREVAGDEAFIKAITTPGDPRTQAMIEQLQAEHPADVMSDETLRFNIRERTTALRAERDEAIRHQTTAGQIGGFVGTAIGAVSDPIVLGTLPLGASWATGIVRTMLVEAGVNAAVETAIQAPVFAYKQELASPWSVREAVGNIAAAGIGAAALSGVVKGAAAGIRRIAGYDDLIEAAERVPNPTSEERAALDVLRQQADSIRQSPFIEHPEFDSLHLDALAKASDDIANSRPVDLNSIIEQPRARETPAQPIDLDPEEALSVDVTRQRVSKLLDAGDVMIRTDEGIQRSAREIMQEIETDERQAKMLQECLLGG